MIKIFISSTFQDMHNERDALQCITLPLEELRLPEAFAHRTPRSLGLPDTVRLR